MSEYIKQLKIQVAGKVPGVKFQDKSAMEVMIMKEGKTLLTIRDEKDYITLTTADGKSFKYDKWYTKPENLAETIKVYVERLK
ncbi:hypothetical protein [Desulfurococcus mucosus]|uniref:Uncharacterized protein n=1 Tax=Desulfurococcus mucosus (strain ATCC 35584 / DSM 2162 / JCM 9187 / O7/1) TaxID=765177 RepID=E8RAI7_DESM0|nr:hypothetical protein [Desulfurococcus mucosus]ADV64397.1 hypothetical protein Desmu_0078 [Desulfurococcus mucosus DSM 2162]